MYDAPGAERRDCCCHQDAPHAYEIFQKKQDGAIKILLCPDPTLAEKERFVRALFPNCTHPIPTNEEDIMSLRLGDVAAAVGKGLFAGVAVMAAMTVPARPDSLGGDPRARSLRRPPRRCSRPARR